MARTAIPNSVGAFSVEDIHHFGNNTRAGTYFGGKAKIQSIPFNGTVY